MLGYSININNLCCNKVVLKKKKKVKALKIAIFGINLCKKGVRMGHIQDETQIILEELTDNKKSRSSTSKNLNFLF